MPILRGGSEGANVMCTKVLICRNTRPSTDMTASFDETLKRLLGLNHRIVPWIWVFYVFQGKWNNTVFSLI